MTTDKTEEQRNAEHKAKMQEMQAAQREKVKARREKKGVLLVNTGKGKGKSTAGFGVLLRSVGNGFRVGVVQFIKGAWKTGEKEVLSRFPEVDVFVCGEGFTWNTQDRERDIAAATQGFEKVKEMIAKSQNPGEGYQLLLLDEINIALHYDYLPLEEVLEVLKNRPEHLHIVVTGRYAKEELVAIADTVTEMTPIKHAFEAGIRAQRGIEF